MFAIERRLLTTAASLETQTLVDLAQHINRRSLGIHSVSEWSPFEVYQKVRTAEAEKNLRLLKTGNLEGYGLAVINPDKDTVCGSDAADKYLGRCRQRRLKTRIAKLREHKTIDIVI